MKRAQAAALLAVLLVAAVAAFVLMSGSSTTGLVSGYARTVSRSPIYRPTFAQANAVDKCGKTCTHDSDCGGKCGICSPSTGQWPATGYCIGLLKRPVPPQQIPSEIALAEFRVCMAGCENAQRNCTGGTYDAETYAPCTAAFDECRASCEPLLVENVKK